MFYLSYLHRFSLFVVAGRTCHIDELYLVLLLWCGFINRLCLLSWCRQIYKCVASLSCKCGSTTSYLPFQLNIRPTNENRHPHHQHCIPIFKFFSFKKKTWKRTKPSNSVVDFLRIMTAACTFTVRQDELKCQLHSRDLFCFFA